MRAALLVTVLAASALAGPTGQRETCALHCNYQGVFTYQQGKSYVYQYEARTSTSLLNTLEEHADVHVTATAHIDVTSPCEYSLRLTDVNLEGSSHAEEFAAAITRSPLRFSFQDGKVESVCGEVSEPAWVTNFKRGVLSTFQNTVHKPGTQDIQETDISGTCVTHYSSRVDGNVLTVDKVKDLNSCTQRPDFAAYITSSAYISDSPIQSLPIFNSDNRCHQTIEAGVIKTAECHETHKFRPFSTQEGGAVTTVKTTLVLVSQNQPAAASPGYEFVRKSPVFEKTTSASAQAEVDVINQILAELVQAAHGEVRPEAPTLFSKLVASLKPLDYPTLTTLYSSAKGTHSLKFLVDAMPLVGTGAAVGVVKDMFMNGDITDTEADVWFTSLAFFKNPTSDIFTSVAPLLEANPSKSALLGTSALVNTFCKLNTQCSSEPGVEQVLRIIENQVGSGCRTITDEDKMKVLVALKALGNAGHLVNANSILQRCYTEDNAMEVRVAAIEAWRHTPCEYDRSHLLAAFQDETQDSEIRIAAYLAVMTCPTETVITTVKDRLTSEAVNQVGSFVWTHLTNLQESAAPGKQWVRDLIGEELLSNKFNTQALKFSRNYESSFFTEELNIGAALESNVIFSSKSYLPRSAMLNFTIDLFGESINLFEVGGRIQGFESYVEKFFGPSGYFPQETIEGVLKNLHESKADSDETTLEDFLERATDEPEGSYYLRMFGNELHYNHFHGLDNLLHTSNPLDMIMGLLQGGDIDYTKSVQVIDSDYSIPTVSGLPVTLTAKGTATLALRMNGNINANSLTNFIIEGHFHPSAAVNMDGVMMVDAHVTRKGLKISSTLHTSTSIDGKVHINGGKLVDIAINTPKDRVEVIDVNTKFFIMEDDDLTETEPENQVVTSCSHGQTGMQVCKETNYITASGYYYQPYGGRVYLRKTDTQTGYILKYTMSENEISLLMDTPGSQHNHKIYFNIRKSDNAFQFNLQTRYLSATGNVEFLWQRDRKLLNIDINLSNGLSPALKAELVTSFGEEIRIEPSLLIKMDNQDLTNIHGSLISTPAQRKLSLELTVENHLSPANFSLRTSIEGTERSTKVDLTLTGPGRYVYVQGELECINTSIFWTNEIEYVIGDQSKQIIKYNMVYRKDTSEEATTYYAKFDLSPTQYSPDPILLEYKVILSSGRMESSGTLIHSRNVVWHAEELWAYVWDETQLAWTGHAKVTCPYHGIETSSTNEFKWTHNELSLILKRKMDPVTTKEVSFEAKRNEDREMSLRIVTKHDFNCTFEAIFAKIADGHYRAQVTNECNGHSEFSTALEGTIINNSIPGKVDVKTEVSIKLRGRTCEAVFNVVGDAEGAKMEMRTKMDQEEHNLVMEATRSSLLLDTNVYNHIVVNAGVRREPEDIMVVAGVEWDKDNDPTKSLVFKANIKNMAAEAEVKFLGREIFASGNILNDGVALEGRWAPDQAVKINLSYQLFVHEKRSLNIAVETPFPGWQKQDATVSLTLKQNEFNAQAMANWKNSQQMALTINANLQPGLTNNALYTNVLFSSPFTNFEHLTFVLDHKMDAVNINTNIEATWNDNKINGVILLSPTDNGIDGSATFTSPFTQEAAIILHHQLAETQLSSSLQAKYGEHVSTATLTGHVITHPDHDIAVHLKVPALLEFVPEMEVAFKYNLDSATLALVTEGSVRDNKFMFSINGEKTVTENSTSISGDARFITPFTRPLTATLSHTHDSQQFDTKLDVSSNGSMTFHSYGHVISRNDIEFSTILDTPNTKVSFVFNHKISDNNLTSQVKVYANDERITVSLSGILDEAFNIADVEGEVSSNIEGLDDMKMKLNSVKQETGRTSKIILSQGTNSVSIVHNITYTNTFNWVNSFVINNNYRLRNTQTHTGTQYGHEMEVGWDDKIVSIKGNFDVNFSLSSSVAAVHLAISTPWECMEDIDISLNMQQTTSELKLGAALNDKQECIIELTYSHRLERDSFSSEASLATPCCETLGYKIRVQNAPKTISLVLLYGEAQTSIEVGGDCQPGKMESHMNIASDFLPTTIAIEGSLDTASDEKTFTVTVTTDSSYVITGSMSGVITNPKLFLSIDLPLARTRHIEFMGEYQVEAFPFTLDTEVKVDSHTYKVNGMVNPSSFQLEVDLNDQKGSVNSIWEIHRNKANVELQIQSPFRSFMNVGGNIMYDFESTKRIDAKVIYNNHELTLSGRLEGRTFIFEGRTPFTGWENLGASLSLSNSAITASASKNDEKIEVTGTMHLKSQKGKVELSITTPSEALRTIHLEAIYNFIGDSKMVQFKSNYDNTELLIKGAVNLSNYQVPEMTLNLVTPFPEVRNLRAEAKWNVMNPVKTAEVVVHHNNGVYNWRLEATSSNPLTGHVTTKLSTPLPDWSDVSLKAAFDFTTAPYTVSTEYKKGDLEMKLEGHLSVTENAIQGDLVTPITGWESLTFTGEYYFQDDHLTGSAEIQRGSETIEVKSDILFNTATPKIKVEVKTPIPEYTNMELSLESNLHDLNKKFHIAFIMNTITYSADITGKFAMKTGVLQAMIKSPITGITNLEIASQYDLNGDVKRAELTLRKEEQTQYFSVTGGVDGNNIVLDVRTPYENFEAMKMNADYTSQPGLHRIVATFTRNISEYKFLTEVTFSDNSANIKLSTPIEAIRNVELNGMFDIQENRFMGSLSFNRNGDIFELNSNYSLNPMKSHLEIGVTTPITGWTKLGLNLNYDLISDRKVAEVVLLKEEVMKQIVVEAYYNLEMGSLKLRTPVAGFEVLGAEYTLLVDANSNKVEAFVKTNFNSQEWSLSAFGQYSASEIIVRLQTPFPGFEIISIEGGINNNDKTGKGIVHIGPYTFTINASYALDNMFLEITTPYTPLTFFLVSFRYNFTPRQMEGTMNVSVNENSYKLHGALQISPRSSGLVLMAATAIPEMSNMSFQIKYDLDNVDELVFVAVSNGENEYKLSVGGHILQRTALFKCGLTTPFTGWRDVKFQTKIDLMNDDKMLEIFLERDGSVKEISIHGKLIGTEINFDLRTPFMGFHHFNVSGSLNRARRSLEFQMMNDAGEASIAASFHGAKLELVTPFERFEEVKWEVKKVAEGKYVGEWRRNDNFVNVILEGVGSGGSVTVQARSEVNGWEFLGLTGRLDSATYEAFLSGQRNERKIEIAIRGKHDPQAPSSFTLDIKTPYDNYLEVKGNLRYNLRRRQLKLLVESESSDFKIDIQARRGWQVNIHVPHPEKPTDLQVDLARNKGKIFFDSRFEHLPSYKQEYEITTNPLGATAYIEVDEHRIFNLECEVMPAERKFHFEVHTYRGNRHTTIHIHSESFTTSTILVKQEEGGRTREFKAEMNGEGDLPTHGTMHIDITNTFAEPNRHVTLHVEIDRRTEDKHIKIEATFPGNRLYVINIDYSMTLRDLRNGKFSIAITTPDRRQRMWNNIAGDWNIYDLNQASIKLSIGGITYSATGKLGLRETDMVLTPEGDGEVIFLQWKFMRDGDRRDYFFKVGREYRYVMFKLKGNFNANQGDVELGFKLGRIQRHEFHCTNNWTHSDGGSVNASGTFNYAQYEGTHELSFNRNAAERSADFTFTLRSNNPAYRNIDIHGSYDFYHKFKTNFEVNVNQRISRVDIDISDFNPRRSRNTIESHIPILGEYASFSFILQHDFRNNDNRYIHAIANFGGRESYVKAHWKRSPNLDTLEGTIDIKSRFIGEVHINGKWDVSDMSNANADADYKRTLPQGNEITGTLSWKRVRTADTLMNELNVESNSPILSHLRAFANVDFSSGFHLTSGLEVNERHINVNLNVGNGSISGEVTTPFQGFESIKGMLTYSLGGRNMEVTLKYERGNRQVDMSLVINRTAKRKGNLEFTLTSPFENFRNMKITATWNRKEAIVDYVRNEVSISMRGNGRFEASRSEFNFTFTTPDGRQVVLAGAYDVQDLIRGVGTEPKRIAGLQIQINELDVSFNINGFRNRERVYVEIDGHSSLLRISTFHLKLNSELNAQNRTGIFELIMNDFVFKVENTFERYEDNGYYLRSKIESSLTPLPALVFGLGFRNGERIITVGYGENREITFSVKSDNNYRRSFSGFVEIPNFGYDGGVKYEVEYKFPNANQLLIELDMELGETGQEAEARFQYDSEGVQARLSSPFTGRHSIRARRSITSDSFFTEVGYNEYNLRLRGGFNNDDIKHGGMLEGEVFGHRFLLDYLFQTNGLNYSEGKLIIQTPFQGMENMGGLFTVATEGNGLKTQAELLLPFSTVPKITLDADISLGREIKTDVTLDVADAQFIFRGNLVSVPPGQGFRGKVEILTPFHPVSHVTLEGNIKTESPNKIGAEFKLVEPYTTHRLEMKYELNPNKVAVSTSIRSVSYNGVNINFTLEGLQDMHKKLLLQVNNEKLIAEYNMDESMFIFHVNTLYSNVSHQLSVDAQYPSLQNMAGSVAVVLGEMKHSINGEFDISTNRVKAEVQLASTLFEGNRQLKFDLSIPSQPFKQISVDISLTTSQTHIIHFEFDSRTGVQARVLLDTPAMENVSAVFVLSGAAAEFTVQTPTETHSTKVSWRMTQKMPADYTGIIELESPLLGEPYKLSVVLGGGRMNKIIKVELQVGSTKHLLEGNVYMRNNAGGFSLTLETPFRNVEKAVLEASLVMGDKNKVHVAASLPGYEHSFDSEVDITKNSFMAEAKSPCIPTGFVKVETTLHGHQNDMKLNFVLMNAVDTISGNLITTSTDMLNFMFKVEIATPIPNFQNVNCLVKMSTEEFTNFIFSLDYPITFKISTKFSNSQDLLTSNITVTTSLQRWEYMEADLQMPLDRFAPSATLEIPGHKYGATAEYKNDGYSKLASANLFLDDEVHSGKVNIRTKAPYELGYDIDFHKLDTRFHLKTDSSFFSVFM